MKLRILIPIVFLFLCASAYAQTGVITCTNGQNCTTTSLSTNVIPKANSVNSIINSVLSDNGTTLSYTGTGGISAVSFSSTGASGAGAFGFSQGTDNCAAMQAAPPLNVANSICWEAPPTVNTTYHGVFAATPSTGFAYYSYSAPLLTESFVGSTGGGNVVLSTSPTLTAPNLGIPSAVDLTNASNLPDSAILVGAVTDDKASLANKPSVAVVAVANLTLSGAQTIDGVAGTAGTTTVLATGQSTGSQNGPWVMQSSSWTRPAWYTSANSTQALQYSTVYVRTGTLYTGTTWNLTTAAPITIDTTSTTWSQIVSNPAMINPGCDGSTDMTTVLQTAITNNPDIYITPQPGGACIISSALSIPSNRRIRVSPTTTIQRAASSYSMAAPQPPELLMNAHTTGDSNITVEGGIWDGNPSTQTRHDGSNYIGGTSFRFENVTELRIHDLTMVNSLSWGMHILNSSYVFVDSIRFNDSTITVNQDGVHMSGPISYANISNLAGATGDDVVAVDPDDSGYSPTLGNIYGVSISNINVSPNGAHEVASYVASHNLVNLSISGISGANTGFNGVFFGSLSTATGTVRGISVSNVGAWNGVSVIVNIPMVDLQLSNVLGGNGSLPLQVQSGGNIGTLQMSNIYADAPSGAILTNAGTITHLELSNIALQHSGSPLITNTGTISNTSIAGPISSSSPNVVTFSATPTFDAALSNTQKITLTGNVTSSTLSNANAGEQLNFIICQDATGGRTFVWPSQMHGAMTIGSTLSQCSAQNFMFDGTNAYALSAGVTNQ